MRFNEFNLNEGYTVTRGIDTERYQPRPGLEGPFSAKNGKVVYYDKQEGKYYDPDTDMYIDYNDWQAMNEQGVAEAQWKNMDSYERDYAHSVAGMSGRRNREDDEHHEIDQRREQQLAQYTQSGKFWLKFKDSGKHVNDQSYTGKAAANAAALALLKQQPELKGNLLITAYGPGGE